MRNSDIALIGLGLLILERLEYMEKKLTDAISDLNTEVEDETSKLESIKTYVQGVPDLIAAAVAEALANAGVEESTAADQIEAAVSTARASVTDALSAIDANTPAGDTGTGTGTGGGADTGGADTGLGGGGGDTTGTGGADAGGGGDATGGGDTAGAGTGDGTGTGTGEPGTGDGTTGTGDGTGGAPIE